MRAISFVGFHPDYQIFMPRRPKPKSATPQQPPPSQPPPSQPPPSQPQHQQLPPQHVHAERLEHIAPDDVGLGGVRQQALSEAVSAEAQGSEAAVHTPAPASLLASTPPPARICEEQHPCEETHWLFGYGSILLESSRRSTLVAHSQAGHPPNRPPSLPASASASASTSASASAAALPSASASPLPGGAGACSARRAERRRGLRAGVELQGALRLHGRGAATERRAAAGVRCALRGMRRAGALRRAGGGLRSGPASGGERGRPEASANPPSSALPPARPLQQAPPARF